MAPWKTPLKLVPEQYRTKTIISPSGQVRNWEDVDPDYEIYTDIYGKPINPSISNQVEEFGTTGTPMYAGVDLAGRTIRQRAADRKVEEGYGNKALGKLALAELGMAGAAYGGTYLLGLPEVQGALNLGFSYEGLKSAGNRFNQAKRLWDNGYRGTAAMAGTLGVGEGALSLLGPTTSVITKAYPRARAFYQLNNSANSSNTDNVLFRLQNGFPLTQEQWNVASGMAGGGTPPTQWSLKQLPGFQIKSLMTGSPLERQLSKQGTISLKQLQAYIGRNDVSAIDKELIGRVIQNHTGDTHIDYNTLRQEVQGMIPQYNRVQQSQYADYGMDRLGITIGRNNQLFLQQNPQFPWELGSDNLFYITSGPNKGMAVPNPSLFKEYKNFPITKANTFTFESPGIKGNAKHYDANTLGHSRTYTTAAEPDILHVMESQSDWAQMKGLPNSTKKQSFELAIKNIKEQLASGDYGFATKEELENKLLEFTKYLQEYELDPIKQRMVNNYLNRQLQENLRYAAENGQTRMRYPTSETAAKIEGYRKVKNNDSGIEFDIHDIQKEIDQLQKQSSNMLAEEISKYDPFEYSTEQIIDMANQKVLEHPITQKIQSLENQIQTLKRSQYQYTPEHQTILKKYSDFPKQFQKLFGKQAPVRTVTDTKNNTWYEVDVPQNYLDGTVEMLFKKGGTLNHVERFKKSRRKCRN